MLPAGLAQMAGRIARSERDDNVVLELELSTADLHGCGSGVEGRGAKLGDLPAEIFD
jgi:hypothetical protein